MTLFRGILTLFLMTFGLVGAAEDPQGLLKDAYQSYKSAEIAKTIAERKANFNKALGIYNDLETQFNPTFGNGKLYYNIANSFFQVEEYSWAVLHYYRSIALMPREGNPKRNLDVTLEKLGLAKSPELTTFEKIFFFHYLLSLPERLQVFFFIGLLFVLLTCLTIFWPKQILKRFCILVGIVLGVLLLSLGYTAYLAPIEAVLVKSTLLYRDAGEQYAKVSDQPVLSGNKVQVLDVLQQGKWLKILTPAGELGFVPYTAIRVI